MAINVSGRKVNITDSLRTHAEEKIGAAMKVIDIDPLDAEVVLRVEKNHAIANRCTCEVTIRTRGNVVRVEEQEQTLHAAIDVAAARVERKIRSGAVEGGTIRTGEATELDLDALMDELADDEIVRVKELDFEPLTEQEALIQIDLLGHDFFAYIDRDTSAFCVLYRRDNGGYGLLKQKLED